MTRKEKLLAGKTRRVDSGGKMKRLIYQLILSVITDFRSFPPRSRAEAQAFTLRNIFTLSLPRIPRFSSAHANFNPDNLIFDPVRFCCISTLYLVVILPSDWLSGPLYNKPTIDNNSRGSRPRPRMTIKSTFGIISISYRRIQHRDSDSC